MRATLEQSHTRLPIDTDGCSVLSGSFDGITTTRPIRSHNSRRRPEVFEWVRLWVCIA